jgi:hypothetical protein
LSTKLAAATADLQVHEVSRHGQKKIGIRALALKHSWKQNSDI